MSSPFDLLIPKTPVRRESWFWAAVTTADPLRITRDGDTAAMPYIPEALVPVSSLSVGQRVRCQLYNRTLFIIGAAGGVDPSLFGDARSETNFNLMLTAGVWSANYDWGLSNDPPVNGSWSVIVLDSQANGIWLQQIAFRGSASVPDVFIRSSGDSGATWGDWKAIWSPSVVHSVGASGEPGFTNGWGNYGGAYSPCTFILDTNNRVTLGGTVAGGTISHTDSAGAIFRLPANMRPAANRIYVAPFAGVSYGQLNVYPSGYVTAWEAGPGGSNAYVSLDGITFPAAS